jgi:hypothetical protein
VNSKPFHCLDILSEDTTLMTLNGVSSIMSKKSVASLCCGPLLFVALCSFFVASAPAYAGWLAQDEREKLGRASDTLAAYFDAVSNKAAVQSGLLTVKGKRIRIRIPTLWKEGAARRGKLITFFPPEVHEDNANYFGNQMRYYLLLVPIAWDVVAGTMNATVLKMATGAKRKTDSSTSKKLIGKSAELRTLRELVEEARIVKTKPIEDKAALENAPTFASFFHQVAEKNRRYVGKPKVLSIHLCLLDANFSKLSVLYPGLKAKLLNATSGRKLVDVFGTKEAKKYFSDMEEVALVHASADESTSETTLKARPITSDRRPLASAPSMSDMVPSPHVVEGV